MERLTRKFITYRDSSFNDSEGQKVEYHQIVLDNIDPEVSSYQQSTTVNVSKDVVEMLGLNNEETVDALRGKLVSVSGVLFTINGKLKFSVKDIALIKKSA